jgi:hypothetical protein
MLNKPGAAKLLVQLWGNHGLCGVGFKDVRGLGAALRPSCSNIEGVMSGEESDRMVALKAKSLLWIEESFCARGTVAGTMTFKGSASGVVAVGVISSR